MSAMANTTPLVITVTKPATIQEMRMLPPGLTSRNYVRNIMRTSYQLSWTKSVATDEKMFILGWILGKVPKKEQEKIPTTQRRQSAFDRPREIYSPSTTKSKPRGTDSKVHPWGRSRPHRLHTSNEDHPKDRERFRSVGESYDDSFSHFYRDGNRSRHMKRRRDNESPLSSVSKSDSSDRRVWFDELPPESINSYKDRKAVSLTYFMQQKKYVKNPVEIHNIKQKDGETIEDFLERFKVEIGRVKGAPECMRISRFMHGVNNPELTKRLNEHVPKTMEEMMITTTAFIRGEDAATSKKKGHSTDECKQLKKEIKELVRACKLSHLIKEIKHGRDQLKTRKKETTAKDKPTTIVAKDDQTKEMGEHMIHRMCVDCGSSMEILYKHCFNRLRPEIKSQMVSATTSLTGFSGETIWPLGQLRLLVIIGDANHSTRAWMNFMIVRSLSPYNGIIGRPRIREIQAVPSTVHEMLKFPVEGGIVTIRSTVLIPTECTLEVAIEGTLSDKGRTELCSIMKKNLDIFLWKPLDMTGVPRVQKLMEAEIMREVYYHDWLSNPVMLAEPDKEKTSFHTRQGVYCYTKMPFGLKNAGATYQRLMDKAFKSQIGRNIEVYVDDLVVKSYTETEMTIKEFAASNNEAEYEALIAGLWIAAQMGVKNVQEGGKKALHQSPTIRVNGGNSLQAVVPHAVVKMCWTAPGGDARDMIRKCNDCQIHYPITRSLQQSLIPITAPWPVYKWGIDIAGPFPEGPGEIVSDNGKQFSDNPFKDWCDKLNITQWFASVKHPLSNGLVERANRSLEEGIKARLVIPTEIRMPTYRTATVDIVSNDEELRLNLDLLEERRERAAICEAKAKSKMTKYYNARVRDVTLRPGDFVYHSNDASHAVAGGKL
nr:hypothetical protein [Tanacetum cinerariifolium]